MKTLVKTSLLAIEQSKEFFTSITIQKENRNERM